MKKPLSSDPASTQEGVILKGIGGFYYVDTGKETIECKAGGRLRLGGQPPLAGDRVSFALTGEQGLITTILPRKNALIRPPVANIDRLFILASQAPPETDPYLIDKVSVIALRQGIEPIIVLNKTDQDTSDQLYRIYTEVGFPTLRVSAATGEGIDQLYQMLEGRVSAFTGNSGIGKSSVLNQIDSRFSLSVGEISGRINRGRHTTRQVELLRLPNRALVADTPGFSSFEITRMDRIQKDQLEQYFPDIAVHFGRCRFQGCAHIKEPDCVVRQLVESGKIPHSRYESYVRLYDELAQIKDWE